MTSEAAEAPINTGSSHSPTNEAIVLIGLVNKEPVVKVYLRVTRGRAKGSENAERPLKKPLRHWELKHSDEKERLVLLPGCILL